MEKVLDQVLAMVPVKHIEWPLGFDFSPVGQRELTEGVFLNPHLVVHPPSNSYQMRVLKTVMSKAESAGYEVSEGVYELYAALVAIPEEKDCCYKSYHIEKELYVTVKESTQLISKGTTGLATWNAAFCFVKWALANRDLFAKRTVLELGSGLGFAGMAVCLTCKPKLYCFTDCHEEVLVKLKENVQLNLTKDTSSVNVKVLELDWTEDSISSLDDVTVDCIIATDVVYDQALVDVFVKTLRTLLSMNSSAVGYVASTIRNPETYQYFCKGIEKEGITREILELPPDSRQHFQPCTDMHTVELLKLCLG